jgi:hypothetical protein
MTKIIFVGLPPDRVNPLEQVCVLQYWYYL